VRGPAFEIPSFSDFARNVLLEPCHEPVQDFKNVLSPCASHPKMLYRAVTIHRSVIEADVFPTNGHKFRI
jgi:hypothetical protein